VSSNGKSFHIFAFIGYKQYRSIVPIPWLFDSRDIHPCYFKELEVPDYDEEKISYTKSKKRKLEK
jgi:hypothetical protein